jgi:NAD(P)-dependent dehydrogenase (short-subunit alcohol dehydrogenase family)
MQQWETYIMELAGKVAIVTGASSGIGRAAAGLLARAGARVVAGARRKVELDALVAEIAAAGGEAVALAGDVQDEAYARALVETATGASAASTWPSTMPARSAGWGRSRTCRPPTGTARSTST